MNQMVETSSALEQLSQRLSQQRRKERIIRILRKFSDLIKFTSLKLQV